MICHGCQRPIEEGDVVHLLGEKYCGDCAEDQLTVDEADVDVRPTAFHLTGFDGETVVTFHREGRIELGDGVEPDEAAEAFLEHLARVTGWEIEGLEVDHPTVAGVERLRRAAENVAYGATPVRAEAGDVEHFDVHPERLRDLKTALGQVEEAPA